MWLFYITAPNECGDVRMRTRNIIILMLLVVIAVIALRTVQPHIILLLFVTGLFCLATAYYCYSKGQYYSGFTVVKREEAPLNFWIGIVLLGLIGLFFIAMGTVCLISIC